MGKRWIGITATKVRQYTLCERLPFMEVHGPRERAHRPEWVSSVLDAGVRQEERILSARAQPRVRHPDPELPFIKQVQWTLLQMQQGVPEIDQGTLKSDNWAGRPDILQRIDGTSNFGPWMYRPVDAKSGSRKLPVATQRVPVAFYAVLLEKVQGTLPATFATNHYDGESDRRTEDYVEKVYAAVAGIERAEGGLDPGPRLTTACRTCSWYRVCREEAERTNHVTLLPGLRRDSAAALLERGIKSVDDVVADPKSLPSMRGIGTDRSATRLVHHARAYVERMPQVTGTHELPERGKVEAFIDFEGLGQNNSTDAFLFGLLIRHGERTEYRHWFRTKRHNASAWCAFVAAVRGLPKGTPLFHFGTYERQIVAGMAHRTGIGKTIPTRLVDLYETSRGSVAFPAKGFGLKYIAPALGFQARHPGVDGSMAPQLWFRWVLSSDPTAKQTLREYNEDDLRALVLLVDWIRAHVPRGAEARAQPASLHSSPGRTAARTSPTSERP